VVYFGVDLCSKYLPCLRPLHTVRITILQIIYYFCSIQHHCLHLGINHIVFFLIYKSLSLQNKTVLTDEDGMAEALCIINYSWCYMKETDRWESCKQVVLCPSFNKKMPKIFRAFHALLTELSTEDRQRFTIF
jgi:hypothetical protein